MRSAAVISSFVLLLCLSLPLSAGLGPRIWTLDDLAKAPVLVVGRILNVEKGPMRYPEAVKVRPAVFVMNADVEVLRGSYANGHRNFASGSRLHVQFLKYDGIDYSQVPVIFPEIHPGATLLLPFRINVDPVAKSWQLMQDSGYGLTFPVEAKMIIGEKPADNPRAFLTREIANSFSYGSPVELGALWNIACQNPGYLPELMPLLESAIGNNQHQWAAIAAAELAGASGAEWRIDNILNDVEPDAQSPRAAQIKASYQFIRQALQHLPNERAAQKLVIHDIVFNAAAYGDYSTVGLTNYLDDPVFVEDLRSALRKKIPGSVTIASKLATKIPTDCRAEALKRALDVADHPGAYQPTGHGDVYSSMVLIKEYGTLAQRRQLAAISAKYRATYPEYAAFLARWAR